MRIFESTEGCVIYYELGVSFDLFIYTILTPVIMDNKNWQLDKTNTIW